MFPENGKGVYRHNIVGTYNSVGNISAFQQFFHGIPCGDSPEVAVAYSVISKRDTIFFDDFPESFHTLLGKGISSDTCEKVRVFSAVEFHHMANHFLESTLVVNTYITAAIVYGVHHDDRYIVFLCTHYQFIGNFFAFDLLIHDNEYISNIEVNQIENRGLCLYSVLLPIEVGGNVINEQTHSAIREFLTKPLYEPEILNIMYS